jgi:hypothetical protein
MDRRLRSGYALRPKRAFGNRLFVGAQKPLFILLSDGEPELNFRFQRPITGKPGQFNRS